jgi:hypothetical protein
LNILSFLGFVTVALLSPLVHFAFDFDLDFASSFPHHQGSTSCARLAQLEVHMMVMIFPMPILSVTAMF